MVTAAVELELAGDGSVLAATARALAGLLDDPACPATAKAACARELREVMDRWRALSDTDSGDRLDDLAAARARRLAG